MPPRQLAKTAKRQRFGEIANAQITFPVPLAREREHRIGTGMDRPIDHPGEMNPQERKIGVRDGVDQRLNEVTFFGDELEILTAERDDPGLRIDAGHAGDPIAMQPRAINNEFCLELTHRRTDDGRVGPLLDPNDHRAADDRPAGGFDQPGVSLRDEAVACDPGRLDMDRGEASDVRFELRDLFGDQPFDGDFVLDPPLKEFFERRELRLFGGNDHLAADVVGDVMMATEIDHRFGPGFSEAGLKATGFVIDPGMDNTGIATGLMEGEFGFLFEQDDPRSRPPHPQLPRRRQPNDPTPDDGVVTKGHLH